MISWFLYFLKIGATVFGGPFVVLARLQKDAAFFVGKDKKPMSLQEMNETVALLKVVPGPLALHTCAYLGFLKNKSWGALLSILGFALPGALMILTIAYFSESLKDNFYFDQIVKGMQVAALILMIEAARSLTVSLWKDLFFWIFFVSALILKTTGLFSDIQIIMFLASAAVIYYFLRNRQVPMALFASAAVDFEVLRQIAGASFRSAALLFGTSLAIMPYFYHEFVEKLGLISGQEVLNAIAFGLVTPGPVSISVGYIGYKIMGISGAVVALVFTLLPSFLHMTTWFPWALSKLTGKKWTQFFSVAVFAVIFFILLKSVFLLSQQFQSWQFYLLLPLAIVQIFWQLSPVTLMALCALSSLTLAGISL